MNPKSEFIKAIMSVLRLESNIYTTGAIETIIERIDLSDYQLFIAYLGERKSDFEKPIENIAKGVDEFYAIKLKPFKDKANKAYNEIGSAYERLSRFASKKCENLEVDKNQINNYIDKNYSKQSDQSIEFAKSNYVRKIIGEREIELMKSYLELDKSNEFYKRFIIADSNSQVFSNDLLDVIYNIGIKNLITLRDTYCVVSKQSVYEYFLSDKIRPSITDKITMFDDNKINNLVSNSVKQLIENNKKSFVYE